MLLTLRRSRLFLVITATLLAAGCGGGDDAGTSAGSTSDGVSEVRLRLDESESLGAILVGPNGHTLYLFARDEPNESNCDGSCADSWPPLNVAAETSLVAEGFDGQLAVIERTDGSHQVTLDGIALYYFAGDDAPGETTGHEVGGVWFVAQLGSAAAAEGDADAGY